MALKAQELISAQVVLRSASGKMPDAHITAETINQYLPSPEAASQARAAYADAGFEVGTLVANNFSITAPAATFEDAFHTKLRRDAHGGIQCVRDGGSAQSELPLQTPGGELSQHVAAVTFSPPPDFGPAKFNY